MYPGDVFSPVTITWEERVEQASGTWHRASQKTRRISVPPFPAPSWNNPRGRDTSGSGYARVCAPRGYKRLTYDKFNARSFQPSFLADTYGPGPHPGIIIVIPSREYLSTRLSIRSSVRPSIRFVHSFRVCPLLCLGHTPSPAPQKSLFSDAFEDSPWSKPLLLLLLSSTYAKQSS